jgi:ABC-2 type transport system permease protein
MKAIFLKELRSFFTGFTGYLVMGIFLILSGLFLFVFEGDFNLIDFGFADLAPFFLLIPWLFMFLIPAITMRSFTVERNLGTLEMLVTRPISLRGLVLGKYLGALCLICAALLPTLIYVYSISVLGEVRNNLDYGVTAASYMGAILLATAYTAVGIFCSSLTGNQIISFLLAALLSFFMYYGLEGLGSYTGSNDYIKSLGLKYHYESIARGVIDTRNVVYMLSISFFFIVVSELTLRNNLEKR